MDTDVSAVLAYEVKKEIAERYFGFRRFIEQEKENLFDQAKRTTVTVEQEICYDLIRIYIMLKSPVLIKRFFGLTGLDESVYYDDYVIQSPTIRKRVFANQNPKGLTRSGRFKRLFFSSYDSLAGHIGQYRESIAALLVEHETIVQEINLFYRQTDLSQIMGFLRNLDQTHQLGSDLANATTGLVNPSHFEEKMRVHPPHPVHKEFSSIQPIPAFLAIKKELKKLAEQALKLSDHLPDEY